MRPTDQIDEEESDRAEEMVKKMGCLKQHNDTLECYGETKDWRKCQKEVAAMKMCVNEYMAMRAKQPGRSQTSKK